MDDRDAGSGARVFEFVYGRDGQVLGADPRPAVGTGAQGVGAAPIAAGPLTGPEQGRRAQAGPIASGVGPAGPQPSDPGGGDGLQLAGAAAGRRPSAAGPPRSVAAAAGLVREVVNEAGVVELITRLITRGLGIALLPSAFSRPPTTPDRRRSRWPTGPHRIEYLAWSRFNPSPAGRAMPDVLGVRARARPSVPRRRVIRSPSPAPPAPAPAGRPRISAG
ncbi:hypothetical protein ACIRU3_47420 [Streptomyces sp. NPDC101151]|uniref:hypothetical protein n=1 Tax=Streptomyces sp. NPDC101151 TaxID=3366115 RepID=UPI003815CF17